MPIFNKESGILYSGSLLSFRGFGWNLLGVLVIMAWSAALAFLLFIVLHVLKQLRVSEEIELKGESSEDYNKLASQSISHSVFCFCCCCCCHLIFIS